MKYLRVLLVTFMLLGVAHATELEQSKAEYQNIVSAFTDNVNSQKLLLEGFKITNSTYRALVKEQARLQELAQNLAEKIKELEASVEDAVEKIEQ